MLTLASDFSSGKLYEAFRDQRGFGRISVRAQLTHRRLPVERRNGEVWGPDAALVILQDLGVPARIELAEQLLTEVIDPLPYTGWVLTEEHVRAWLARKLGA